MVISFYKEDDISRPMPGKKDCFTIEKNGEKLKVQKKLVLSNLKETYRQFKDLYPETKLGFSKFSSLRQESVFWQEQVEHILFVSARFMIMLSS